MEGITEALRKRKELEAEVMAKAMEDDTFRVLLKSDPKKAIAQIIGKELPEALNIQIVEETADTLVIGLPPKLEEAVEDAELTDDALDNVAGGILGGIVAAAVSDTGVLVYGISGGDD